MKRGPNKPPVTTIFFDKDFGVVGEVQNFHDDTKIVNFKGRYFYQAAQMSVDSVTFMEADVVDIDIA